jgi:hypothetical protein
VYLLPPLILLLVSITPSLPPNTFIIHLNWAVNDNMIISYCFMSFIRLQEYAHPYSLPLFLPHTISLNLTLLIHIFHFSQSHLHSPALSHYLKILLPLIASSKFTHFFLCPVVNACVHLLFRKLIMLSSV